MKSFFYIFIGYFFTPLVVSADDLGLFGDGNNAVSQEKLRTGDIHTDDIPNLITGAINFFMGIAGTIAIIFVIIGAYKILFGSLQQDKSKGKDTIVMAIIGFILASLSWFIIRLLIDNFSNLN